MPKRSFAADTLSDDDERLWLNGKGGASFFCPLKWLVVDIADAAESMPHWKVGHTANSFAG